MRRIVLLAGSVLAVGVLASGSALAAVRGSDLSLKGSVSGTSAHNLATGKVHAVSTGQLTHLGLTTVEQTALVVPAGPTIFSWSGTFTLTAANGDQMSGTTVGTCTPTATSVRCVVDFTSTGGTGRFADASATLTMTLLSRVSFDPGPPPISYGEHQNATLVGHMSW
jgi:hypothetical protein